MKKFVSILLAVVLIFSVLTCVGCEADKKEKNTITYYHYEPQVSTVSSLIYDYNKKFGNTDYKINVVEFDDMKEMASRLSTEIMAGKGPDIITSGELSLLSLSTEKLIKQGVFANIDDIISNSEDKDKLKLSDYNSNILDAGVYDGKRYFIPVTFEPQILLSSSSKLSKYLDNEQPDLTYGNIKELSGNINNDDNNQALFSGVEDYKNVFLNLIDENVDFYSQKYDFDSDDFRKSVTSLKELYSSNEKNEDNIVPMLSSNGQIELFALYDEIADIENDNDEPIILNTPNKDGESTGVITDAIFISNNSDNKEKALEFIEYALSEKVQSDFCGANIEEYLPTTSYGSGWEYPVNNESYSKLFDKAKEVKYINNTANISEANFMYAKDYVDNIKSYRLYGLYNYYNTEVIGDIVDKFLSDEIDENKFLKELKSRTEIYLDEQCYAKIRDIAGTDRQGTSAYGLVKVIEHFGFQQKVVEADKESLTFKLPIPVIAHVVIDDSLLHYVVITKVQGDIVVVFDPSKGIAKGSYVTFNY